MVQLILKYKVSVTETIYDFCYSSITIDNSGKGITVIDLTREEASKIIKENNLELAPIEETGYEYGRVYHDRKFKKFVNQHPRVKKNLFKIIEDYETV